MQEVTLVFSQPYLLLYTMGISPTAHLNGTEIVEQYIALVRKIAILVIGLKTNVICDFYWM